MARETRESESAESENQSAPIVPLPTLTHLQFLVLDVLARQRQGTSAQQLRDELAAGGQQQQGPKFYQLMRRLQEAGLIQSWQQGFDVAGTDVKRSFYKLERDGKVAWELTLKFYATRLKAHSGLLKDA